MNVLAPVLTSKGITKAKNPRNQSSILKWLYHNQQKELFFNFAKFSQPLRKKIIQLQQQGIIVLEPIATNKISSLTI